VTPKVQSYVRAIGGAVELYANVTDNCGDSDANLDVDFDLGTLGSYAANYSAVPWEPIAGGPTFTWRATLTLNSGDIPNGAAHAWTITATDLEGNVTSVAGTAINGDGAGPTALDAEMVSAFTNQYYTALGRGEIPSDGTARASGSYVYATATDPSGVATITANLDVDGANRIRTGFTAVPVASGAFTVNTGPAATQAWAWRSAAQVINTGLPDGIRNFRITATDALGNATTSGNLPVEIDDTRITSASCAHAGNASNTLNVGDTSTITFPDGIWISSVLPVWSSGSQSFTAVVRNGTRDYVSLNTDLGTTFLRAAAYNTSFNLNATTWVTGNVNIPGTTISMPSSTQVRLTWGTPATTITDRNSSTTFYFGASIRDLAGNTSTNFQTVGCTTAAW
jgi:hypothetical protein